MEEPVYLPIYYTGSLIEATVAIPFPGNNGYANPEIPSRLQAMIDVLERELASGKFNKHEQKVIPTTIELAKFYLSMTSESAVAFAQHCIDKSVELHGMVEFAISIMSNFTIENNVYYQQQDPREAMVVAFTQYLKENPVDVSIVSDSEFAAKFVQYCIDRSAEISGIANALRQYCTERSVAMSDMTVPELAAAFMEHCIGKQYPLDKLITKVSKIMRRIELRNHMYRVEICGNINISLMQHELPCKDSVELCFMFINDEAKGTAAVVMDAVRLLKRTYEM